MQHCISKLIFGGVLCLGLTRAGDIEGSVVIHRTLTKRKVTVAAGQYDRGASVHLGSAETEDRLAFERTHVVIYLEGQHASPPVTASIEQKERQFSPDVLVIPSGSSISFPNMDPIFHNVFSLSKPKTFDLGNYPKGQTRLVTFPKPGIVFVNCRLHPNMTATIVVTPNQWNTIAGSSGDFALHEFRRQARVLHLVADGYPKAATDELGDVTLRGMIRNAAHRDCHALLLVAGGQGDLQLLRSHHGVFKEELVEISQSKQQEGVGVALLNGAVLPHQRCGEITHGHVRVLEPL